MQRWGLLVSAMFLVAWANSAISCTLVFRTKQGECLVANNLDCDNVFPRVWFVPGNGELYGRFCFGTDVNERIAEGGMNEWGLYIGVNALDESSAWKRDPGLPDWEEWEGWFGTGVPDGILARCKTVEEAEAVFRSHNLFTLDRVKFLLADRSGASVVVEWNASRGLVFLERGEEDFQISTNFVTSKYSPEEIPCYRYELARMMLEGEGEKPGIELLRDVLSATHLEFQTPTVLSAVCDLASGDIHLYYFHYFEKVCAFNLRDELEKGARGYLLSELVPIKPYVAKVYEDFSVQTGG